MNKADITNLVTVLIMAYGYSNGNETIFLVGLFALSGALTNTIAIHMLFEKVPFLYGSGVIELKFKEFKDSIKNLLMQQFFTKERLNKFFEEHSFENSFDFEKILDSVDLSLAFESLKSSVVASPLGAMLSMFGGEKVLDGLKDMFIENLKNSLKDIAKQNSKNLTTNSQFVDEVHSKLTLIVDDRLDELTPKMVKQIMQDMIREHLFWLVVWGAFFGGIIGFVGSLIK